MAITPEQLAELARRLEDLLIFLRSVTQDSASLALPSSAAWMTEDEEVAWIGSLGFQATVADLRASYASFVPRATKTATTSTMNDTETDDLRNYYRLWKRTSHPGFLAQAQIERDWQVAHYSQVASGLPSAANLSHFYLMGLVDWWVDHRDSSTLDAIHRLVDWVSAKIEPKLVDTRSVARPLECLAHYREKIGQRDVSASLTALVRAVREAPSFGGVVSMPKWYSAATVTVPDVPAGVDLRAKFPANAAHLNHAGVSLVRGAATYNVTGFPGATSNQDAFLVHALGLAARVMKDPTLLSVRDGIARAYASLAAFPWTDPDGKASNMIVPYNFDPSAPELAMFLHRSGDSTPLYVTQIAPCLLDPAKRLALSRQALLRQYGQHSKILPSELAGKPRWWPWQTWEAGFFLTQK